MSARASTAVMARRDAPNGRDYYPTPPWATRALVEHVWPHLRFSPAPRPDEPHIWEPAAGCGAMSRVLEEYGLRVRATDIEPRGDGIGKFDFLDETCCDAPPAWVVTNPPFSLAQEFVERGLAVARRGVCVLVRLSWLETIGRFEMFSRHTPQRVGVFSERVPFREGRLDAKVASATAYAWIVFVREGLTIYCDATITDPEGSCLHCELVWIPPCRAALERDGDYE